MGLTKATARQRVLQLIDASGSERWDVTPNGEVDRAIGIMQAREWRRILESNPYYRFTKASYTRNASGRLPLLSLTSGTGDATTRLYRVLSVEANNFVYEQAVYRDFARAESLSALVYVWYQEGDDLMFLPREDNQPITVAYNHLPRVQHELADEGSDFVFPEFYEDVALYEAGAMLLAKGGAETREAVELKGLAKDLRDDLLLTVRRVGMTGVSWTQTDDALAWGG